MSEIVCCCSWLKKYDLSPRYCHAIQSSPIESANFCHLYCRVANTLTVRLVRKRRKTCIDTSSCECSLHSASFEERYFPQKSHCAVALRSNPMSFYTISDHINALILVDFVTVVLVKTFQVNRVRFQLAFRCRLCSGIE